MVLVTVAESNFNTSYVIIQPLNAFQKLNRCCLFQYILCYYSTKSIDHTVYMAYLKNMPMIPAVRKFIEFTKETIDIFY